MESIWFSPWIAYGRHHSVGVPYGFHSGHGIEKWLGCQPKNGMTLESSHFIWNPSENSGECKDLTIGGLN